MTEKKKKRDILLFRMSMFTCSAMLLTVSRRFSRTILRIFAMFSSVLLVPGRPDLSSSVTLSLPSDKTFHPPVNCCFLHGIIPVNLHQHLSDFVSTLSKFKTKFNVRSLLWFNLRHSRGGSPKHTQTVTDATQKETAIDQLQQHWRETLMCQRRQTIVRLLSSAATASIRWRVRELNCPSTYCTSSGGRPQ